MGNSAIDIQKLEYDNQKLKEELSQLKGYFLNFERMFQGADTKSLLEINQGNHFSDLLLAVRKLNFLLEQSETNMTNDISQMYSLKEQVNVSERKYKLLFESSPDIIIQVDLNYKVLVIHIPGRDDLERLLGLDIFLITPGVFHDKMKKALTKVFVSGETVTYESEGEVEWGYRCYLNYLSPIKDNDGNIVSAYFVSRDITDRKKVEKLLQENEAKLKALFDSSVHRNALLDKDMKVIWFNKAMYDILMLRFNKKISKGDHFLEFIYAENKDSFCDLFSRVIKGEYIHYERKIFENNNIKWGEVSLIPVYDNAGDFIGISLVVQDITDKKKTEIRVTESENKLQAIFDSSNQIQFLLDFDMKIVWFNKVSNLESESILGKELLLGESVLQYILPSYHNVFMDSFKLCKKGKNMVYEVELFNKDNIPVWMEIKLQPVYSNNNDLIGVSVTGTNITERKEDEVKLRRINEELVYQNQQLNQYSYIVSHNLRGPIATLIGLSQLLQDDNYDFDFKKEVVGHISRSVNHLDDIIKDLNIILSQTTSVEQTSVLVNFDNELIVVQDLLKTQIEKAGATINTDFTLIPAIRSIKSYVHSILLNLMSNSLKYKKIHESAIIDISTKRIDDTTICLVFSDNGLGIDLEKYGDKIFGFYKRFHTHVEGKGMGLLLLKTQIELLGGKVEVSSKVDIGTTFTVYFKDKHNDL